MPRTEKERMLAGEPYRSRDPELLARYHHVRTLLAEYATTASTDGARKRQLLDALLGGVGEGVWIEAPFYCDYGEQITMGDGVFINYNCVFLDSNRITIGDNALLGPGVQIYTATHPIRAEDRIRYEERAGKKHPYYLTQALPVEVGANTWIGGGALLLPGTTIGDNTTIGAGSVVTKPIPADCFAAGNPCRVIRRLD
jgi:maltose O-acetyltransferase